MQTSVKKRQSNFELVRIAAMAMIVASHLACHGTQHLATARAFVEYGAGSFGNRLFTSFLNPGGAVGVALFFMLTGYFGCKKDLLSVKKIALEAAFYSFALGIAFALFLAVNALNPNFMGGGTVS